jgi:hypothetical protein
MSEAEFTADDAFDFEDELGEADTLATLLALNSNYIRAFVEADVDWYRDHLADDFVCTLANGRRIGKQAFLQRAADGPGVTEVRFDVVDIDLFRDVALVHGVTHYLHLGSRESTRYTDIWHLEHGRWQAVAAQLTAIRKG